MSEILKRLRGYNPPDRTTHDRRISQDSRDAADEIDRLRLSLARETEARKAAERATEAHAEELAKVTRERDEARERFAALTPGGHSLDYDAWISAMDQIGKLRAERDAAVVEVARWKKSFSGHVYVECEKYAGLVAERDAAERERDEALQARERMRSICETEALPEEAEAILHAVAERDCRCGLWIEPVLCESCRARAFLRASSPPAPAPSAKE